MENLRQDLWNYKFSHVYVEKEAFNYSTSSKILSHLKNSRIIEIDHYKDVFCRKNQNFVLQKNSPKLILAVKKNNFVYNGSEMCDDFGNDNFYYTSAVMNCVYNCEYCYLQGMYPSSNVVIFVNIDDTINEIEKMLKSHPVYLCVSYDTDLMAIENITGFLHKWIEVGAKYENLKIEIRTKSANFKLLKDIHCLDNIILAWTLSPDKIIEEFEGNTPSLEKRLRSIEEAIDYGWRVRLCFDPILYIENWSELYKECIETTFNKLNKNKIYQVSIGVFRVSKDYLKIMSKLRVNSKILAYPFITDDGICSYNIKHIDQMISLVRSEIEKYMSPNKIYM
ncbi:spore photoproduct lyase family protein [Clostridium sp. BL-8]|uniref:SPL family radical SAM protein n=1 Tax=Clostridium sp. BL-8 TaxID=349938 RepID=UPI00098C0D73|nr:radical SAM protein [Clostridium sp. BL-8]OOM77464.1 spore photoproduct lyase [Clostridium sp. BL-8]